MAPIIGAGIFVLTGIATARYAGPAVILSFLLCSFICTLIGLCYAEFASIIPIAGSAYTYTYASLGELIAWIVGWDLILEYSFGAAAVAWGWSGYLSSFWSTFRISLPPSISGTRWDDFVLTNGQWMPTSAAVASGVNTTGLPHAQHGVRGSKFGRWLEKGKSLNARTKVIEEGEEVALMSLLMSLFWGGNQPKPTESLAEKCNVF